MSLIINRMIKFEKLVQTLLNEKEDSTTDAASVNVDPVFDYFTNPKGDSPYDKFAAAFQTVYGKPPLSSPQELQRLLTAIEGSSNKNELTISNFTEYTEALPLIDFILYVAQTALGAPKGNLGQLKKEIQKNDIKTEAAGAVDRYIVDFKKTPQNSWPLDYPSKTAQARMLEVGLRKKLADNVVGTLALENLVSKSIYDAVITLLANRKKIRDPFNIVGPSNKFIDEILFGDYKKYAGGGEMVKGKYARMWDQYSVEKLIELSKSIRNLYEHQKSLFISDEASKQPSAKIPTLEQFIKNKVDGKNFYWVAPQTTGTQPQVQQQNNSFDLAFDLLTKQMLNEVTDPAIISRVKAAVGRSEAARKSSKFGLPNKEQQTNTEQLLTLPDEGYNIKYVMSLTNDPAKDVITKLKQLGDYIAEKEPVDWEAKISGAAQLAKGISSLGGPEMGK